ncbi:glycosyltransferase [Mucilaginibacter sp. X4EP1]|uniref:glycosyltransferase n=1 Tax=Mucilaginibacter sp. X4EP1 TaxID=2723092 RepID=UPI0021672319|nr:glycosyltransferase family 2 protein [Mucilaginibacter sp. X4EP1]MCS3812768.1 hypothetical protein [Mucilaginibacter sp. X4EP1]
MNKVYIILVNYKKYKDTIECLESIYNNGYSNFNVLLVDNSPEDDSYENIEKWLDNEYGSVETSFPELLYPLKEKSISYLKISEDLMVNSKKKFDEQFILIRATNRGFAAANNISLQYLINNGEENSFIWILNNDTVIDKQCLINLTNFYADEKDFNTLIGGKLMHYYNRLYIQAIVADYNKVLSSTSHIGDGELDEGQYDSYKIKPSNYIVGASLFLPISYLRKIGLLNEEYFLFYEELDWKQKAEKLNLGFGIAHNAVIYHKESESIAGKGAAKNMDVADYYSIISRLRFSRRWYPYYFPIVALGVVYALIKRLLQGRLTLVKKITIGILKL